ncbi:lactonase family protein [Parapedobacter sp. 10938]|uniref:lactonase family protein n=1 Tax=Parapedobacter flavus TaxID=3110225 RepID=UPI002DB641C6|nr:lactonase family protein [Parapedobacter sp. 10938]MEC3879343.1 lactonase family protein [Parapedobacter sp. 10938]
MKLLTICSLLMISPLMILAQHIHLLAGTYTQNGKSEGIYVYDFDLETGEATQVSSMAAENPSFLALSANGTHVYAVNENGDGKGAVSAYAYDDETGTLTFLNRQLTQGDHPCHLTTDRAGTHVIASNYSGGSISVFPIGPSGSLGGMVQQIHHEGSGPDLKRQLAPHVHSAFFNPDETQLFVQDLGTDKVNIYDFRPEEASEPLIAAAPPFIATTPGGGPRHVTFSADGQFIYLVEEMAATVVVYQKQGDDWEAIQEEPINEAGFAGADGAADIKLSPDGQFLYASNRGDANTLAIYSVDTASGKLTKVANQLVLGQGPRNFTLSPDGEYLLVANQNTDEVVIFERDGTTGLLSDTGKRIKVGSPVCLVFVSL